MSINYELKGSIFNIQKFSVNDGPGIRTVVFFKGCPLTCKWCSNPESQLVKSQILWDNKKCVRCLTCLNNCKGKAISFKDNTIFINDEKCIGCLTCLSSCANNALESKGSLMSVKEVMDVIMQDKDFYEESKGGVTLSGGEFFLQRTFALELLKACKEKGINTCSETTAYVDSKKFKELIPYFDEMYIDIKHYDNFKHVIGCGVSNEIIIENIKEAIKQKVNLTLRIPVIPSFNDSLDDAKGFANLIKELGLNKVQLLPFHQFGENKYKLLNKNYEYLDVKALHQEDLDDYVKVFKDNGVDAYF